jgi:hypothetical protein
MKVSIMSQNCSSESPGKRIIYFNGLEVIRGPVLKVQGPAANVSFVTEAVVK